MTLLALTVVFVLMEGFLSGTEVGLISLVPARVRHGVRVGHRGAWILDFFMRHPGYLLATALVSQNVFLVAASNASLRAMSAWGLGQPSLLLAASLIISLMLLLSEITFKSWFRQAPYDRCRIFAYPLYAVYWLLWPAVALSARFTGMVNRLAGGRLADDKTASTLMREDFRILLRESEKDELIDPEAADLLERSLDFHRLRVGDVYRPREQVVQVGADATIAEAVALCRSHGISRVPALTRGLSRGKAEAPWCGVFNVYDAFFAFPEAAWATTPVVSVLRPAVTVPADGTMEDAMAKAKRSHAILLVVIPRGHTERHLGIITTTDVARVLFG